MKHIPGIVKAEQGMMSKLNPVAASLLMSRMARKPHTSGTVNVRNADVWNRLSDKDRARVQACLADAAAENHCHKRDLMWAMDASGILHIRKRDSICLRS